MLRTFSIGLRINLLLVLMLLFVAFAVISFVQDEGRILDVAVEQTGESVLEGQRQKLQVATHSMAISLGQLVVGKAPDEQVALIREAVDPIRFEEDRSGYYFVYEGTVNVALPPNKKLQGNDLADLKDKNGVALVSELYEQAQDGGGFVTYIWPKPGAGDEPKLSYAEMIPGTDMWIGTGVYIDNVQAAQDTLAENLTRIVNEGLVFTLGVLGAIFVFVVAPLCVLIGRSVVAPVREATEAAKAIQNGEYDTRLDAKGSDEAASLQQSLNAMAETLSKNIGEIRKKSAEAEEKARQAEEATREAEEARAGAETARREALSYASGQLEGIVAHLSSASEQLSQQAREIQSGSHRQAERISTTATAMEEMNATVLEVARNASQTAELGNKAREQAANGAATVQRTVGAMESTRSRAESLQQNMHELGRQAESIGNVMNVITDIADQTNLLALNAAIEAARAGDAGRGFAVVADEVRKLAEKTMTATKEVGQAITSIQESARVNIEAMDGASKEINEAVELIGESGETLNGIVDVVEQSAEQVQSIATAAEEQSASSDEIARYMEEVNVISNEMSAGVQESTEAIAELNRQMNEMVALVNKLKAEAS